MKMSIPIYMCLLYALYFNRKTPVEKLHTILLGPVKYLLGVTIKSMTPEKKQQMHAKVVGLNMSAFSRHIKGNITRNYGSYVGRDYKLWMQMAVFILDGLIPAESISVVFAWQGIVYMWYKLYM